MERLKVMTPAQLSSLAEAARRRFAKPLWVGAFILWGAGRALGATVWPNPDWALSTPAAQDLSNSGIETATRYAEQHGGGSGCIIRHGYIVREWGDPRRRADIKSATKASIGSTLLGLALGDGLVKLEDPARRHHPTLGEDYAANDRGWLEEITIRHLVTMTAGFDDVRPPRLVRRPGSAGEYSNDGANFLAELLTLKFGEDLRQVLRRRVMEPLGIGAAEWSWRENLYRPKEIGGLPSREFASGLTITHRALARLGLLYLRGGIWKEQRLLSEAYLRESTRATDLPAFVPYYGFFWGSNSRGTFPNIPLDTYWALGLGDSLLLVCPSLDVVVVRLGVGSTASRLPGPPDDSRWGDRVALFFEHIVESVLDRRQAARTAGVEPPYPDSRVILDVHWAPREAVVRQALGSDNWPLTWANDDALYGAYGDGPGFDLPATDKLSLGLARIEGVPPEFRGSNLRAPTIEMRGEGPFGKKASGLIAIDGVLYLWARNASNSQLAWSRDRGATWVWANWRLGESFGCPSFLQFGRNYAGARDDFVYIYSPDSDSAYRPVDAVVLARVPKERIRDAAAYDFFAGVDLQGRARWSRQARERSPVFRNPGRCYRTTVTYHPGLRRYLLVQPIPGPASRDLSGRVDTRFNGGLGIFDAPEPWGPWTTVYYTERWDVGPGDMATLPSKWIDRSGTNLWMSFSGDDAFSVRQLKLDLPRD